MRNASSLSELVVRWQELRERGQTVSPEQLCTGCPELVDELRRQLQALQSIEQFIGAGDGDSADDETGTIPAGSRLGAYTIGAQLGAGGMGIVYRAEDVQLGRSVALKVLRPSLAASSTARQRFLREARAMAAVRHQHIGTIYQVGEEGGTPFLAMELLEGESLATRLARVGRLPVAEVLRVGRALAEGLAAAHARGVIHRDIKPANVWLEPAPAAGIKILDFGLAHVADEAHLTASGVIVGTPAYMAPEQARSRPLDFRCDLFSLGGVLYHASTGRGPFTGADAMAVMLAVTSEQPRAPRQIRAEIPQVVADLVMRLLDKDPAARPASAREVADRLAAIERTPARSTAESATAELTPVPDDPRPTKATPRARRWRWIVATVVLVALMLALPLLLYCATLNSRASPIPAITLANAAQIEKLTVLQRGAREVAWGPAPGQIALLGEDTAIEVLDAQTFKPVRTLAGGRRPAHFAFANEGAAVAWSERTKKVEIRSLQHDRGLVLETANPEPTLAFSPDGKLVAAGGLGTRAELWDTDTGKIVKSFDCGPEGRLDVVFRPNGKHLAIGNRNGPTHLYEAATGKLRYALPRHMSHELKFSPDGNVLAVAYVDGSVGLWDVAGGELRHCRGTAEEVWSLDWSPAGDVLATGGLKGTITFWDPRDLTVLKELHAGAGVKCVRFSPDGSRLMAATTREVHLWGLLPGAAK